jgi:hypothetical protein
MPPQIPQVEETVDHPKHVIVGQVPLKTETGEHRLLHHSSFGPLSPNLLRISEGNQRPTHQSSRVFQCNALRAAIR